MYEHVSHYERVSWINWSQSTFTSNMIFILLTIVTVLGYITDYYHVQTTMIIQYKDIHNRQVTTMIEYGKEL